MESVLADRGSSGPCKCGRTLQLRDQNNVFYFLFPTNLGVEEKTDVKGTFLRKKGPAADDNN